MKTKSPEKTEKSSRKFLEPSEKPKVIYIDNSRNSAKFLEIFLGSIVHVRITVPRQMPLLKERHAEMRKEPLQCCCNQVWTKNGGQIPWNVVAEGVTFKTSHQTGKLHVNGDLEIFSDR